MEAAEAIAWLGTQPLWVGLVVLAVSATLEYVFPPFPGDTVTLAGAMMIGLVGWPWWAVMIALWAGSAVGIVTDWAAGRWLEQSERRSWLHRLLARPEIAERVCGARARFERHGVWFILANRFVPAFRSVFFLVSGMAGLRLSVVLFFGLLSVTLWNGALLALGAAAGFHLEEVLAWLGRYSAIAWGAIGVLVVAWAWKTWGKKAIAKRSKR